MPLRPRRRQVTVDVITRDEMVTAVEDFYTANVPGDDRDPQFYESVRAAGPFELLALYRSTLTVADGMAHAAALRRRSRAAYWALWLYLASTVLYGIRAALLRADGSEGPFSDGVAVAIVPVAGLALVAIIYAGSRFRHHRRGKR